jgi:hypothetical protein
MCSGRRVGSGIVPNRRLAMPAWAKRSSAVSKGRPRSIEVVEEQGERFVVATYADGSVVRKRVDPNERPRRKPRRPIARARSETLNKTRRKQI